MRCQIQARELHSLLKQADPALSKTDVMPALSCFHLEAKEDRLYCTATDLNVGVTVHAPAVVPPGAEGVVLLPGKLLLSLANSFPPTSQVELETAGNRCTVVCGGSRTELVTLDPELYPFPPDPEEHSLRFTIDAPALKTALEQVKVAAGDVQYNVVLFDFDGKQLSLAATDTHRLAVWDGLVKVECQPQQALFPVDPLKALLKLLPDEGTVEVMIGQAVAHFTCGGVRAFTRLANQNFPPYRQVIPKGASASMAVERRVLLDALERAFLVAEQRGTLTQKFKVCVLTLNGQVTLDASSEDGRVHEVIPAEAEGQVKVAFNSRYLLEILKAVPDERVKLGFNGTLRPITVHSEKCFYLLLPVRMPELEAEQNQEGGGA